MPSVPPFIDHALSSRLETVEIVQLAGLVSVVAARLPSLNAAALSVAGGVAAYILPQISISRAAGLGRLGPVEAADVEALVDFYRSRAPSARVLVSPFNHPSLLERLGEHGFRLAGLDTILVRRIDLGDALPAPGSGVVVRVAGPEDAADWVRASLMAFGAPGEPVSPDRAAVFEAAFESPGVTYFIASVNGALAGTAALRLHGKTAYFFAASTLAAHRGRGVQAALILDRLAAARDAGCDLAFTGAAPGSSSQRNFERLGFAPAYSEALMIKRFS